MIDYGKIIKRYLSNIRLPFRGELVRTSKGPVQTVQVAGLSTETLQSLELYQQFGFTSGVPQGSQMVIIPINGDTSHSIIVATEHGAYRLDVNGGEACLYNQWGAKIHLKEEKIIEIDCDELKIKAKDKTTIETKLMELITKTIIGEASNGVLLEAPAIAFSGSGGGSAQIEMTGSATTTGDMKAGSVSLKGHTHPENGEGGGTTGPPVS